MSVCVDGIWHLGAVTAACLADRGIAVVGLAESAVAAGELSKGTAPLFEPDLDDLLKRGLSSGLLRFTDDLSAAVANAELIWITFDTPVDDADRADVEFVRDRIRRLFPFLRNGSVVLISSQLPVGSTAALEREFQLVAAGRNVSFAYLPENLRLGSAIRAFTEPERIVVGIRDEQARRVIEPILQQFCQTLLWTRVESAEMVKHALNAYLATCVTFANEVASISEHVGADMAEVEAALRLDPRVGARAYIRAGAAFGGGTLARDVQFLNEAARREDIAAPVLGAVLDSNAQHKKWVVRHLMRRLAPLAEKQIALLGLAYKAGTDAIRRSVAIELCEDLKRAGARIVAYDPKVSKLPPQLAGNVTLATSAEEVFFGSDAVVLTTEWPEFRTLDIPVLAQQMRHRLLIDQNGFFRDRNLAEEGFDYVVAGRAS